MPQFSPINEKKKPSPEEPGQFASLDLGLFTPASLELFEPFIQPFDLDQHDAHSRRNPYLRKKERQLSVRLPTCLDRLLSQASGPGASIYSRLQAGCYLTIYSVLKERTSIYLKSLYL
jgi:hypothetical protein